MRNFRINSAALSATFALTLLMLAVIPAAAASYQVAVLTADQAGVAPNTDPNMVNPWGISFSPTGPFWLSDNGTGLSTVYNSSGEKIGEVADLIITPEKAVSYTIVGTGGFLGMDQHDVAIPVGQLKLEGDKLLLPGATKEGLKALPKFQYAK